MAKAANNGTDTFLLVNRFVSTFLVKTLNNRNRFLIDSMSANYLLSLIFVSSSLHSNKQAGSTLILILESEWLQQKRWTCTTAIHTRHKEEHANPPSKYSEGVSEKFLGCTFCLQSEVKRLQDPCAWKIPAPELANSGMGKLFARRATCLKNVAAEGRTLSLQSRKIYSVFK